jgi:hypothetical protein
LPRTHLVVVAQRAEDGRNLVTIGVNVGGGLLLRGGGVGERAVLTDMHRPALAERHLEDLAHGRLAKRAAVRTCDPLEDAVKVEAVRAAVEPRVRERVERVAADGAVVVGDRRRTARVAF